MSNSNIMILPEIISNISEYVCLEDVNSCLPFSYLAYGSMYDSVEILKNKISFICKTTIDVTDDMIIGLEIILKNLLSRDKARDKKDSLNFMVDMVLSYLGKTDRYKIIDTILKCFASASAGKLIKRHLIHIYTLITNSSDLNVKMMEYLLDHELFDYVKDDGVFTLSLCDEAADLIEEKESNHSLQMFSLFLTKIIFPLNLYDEFVMSCNEENLKKYMKLFLESSAATETIKQKYSSIFK